MTPLTLSEHLAQRGRSRNAPARPSTAAPLRGVLAQGKRIRSRQAQSGLALLALAVLAACGFGFADGSGAPDPGPGYWGWLCADGGQANPDGGCPPLEADAGSP